MLNGHDETPEDSFLSASVTVNLAVADVAGRPLHDEKEKELFLALISSFFQSEIVYDQLKWFVRNNLVQEPPKPEILIPDRKILIP